MRFQLNNFSQKQLLTNTPLDVHVLMVTAYYSQLETIQQVFSKDVIS